MANLNTLRRKIVNYATATRFVPSYMTIDKLNGNANGNPRYREGMRLPLPPKGRTTTPSLKEIPRS